MMMPPPPPPEKKSCIDKAAKSQSHIATCRHKSITVKAIALAVYDDEKGHAVSKTSDSHAAMQEPVFAPVALELAPRIMKRQKSEN